MSDAPRINPMTTSMTPMTTAEIRAEVAYRLQERLGILCGTNTPTADQKRLAEAEAAEWRERWELHQWKNLTQKMLDK